MTIHHLTQRFIATLALCLLVVSNEGFANEKESHSGAIFAEMSSNITQISGVQPKVVNFDKVDAISGLQVINNQIIVQESGTYFLIAKGNIGVRGLNLYGNVQMWFNRNGKPLAGSTSRQSVDSSTSFYNLVSQAVVSLRAGDAIHLSVVANAASLGLVAIDGNATLPAVPSAVLTMFKIN